MESAPLKVKVIGQFFQKKNDDFLNGPPIIRIRILFFLSNKISEHEKTAFVLNPTKTYEGAQN